MVHRYPWVHHLLGESRCQEGTDGAGADFVFPDEFLFVSGVKKRVRTSKKQLESEQHASFFSNRNSFFIFTFSVTSTQSARLVTEFEVELTVGWSFDQETKPKVTKVVSWLLPCDDIQDEAA